MNIVILGSAHPLRGGGIATFNERLAYALQEQGHQVTIYSFSLQYPSFLFPGKSQFTDEPAPEGLTIKSVINSINPLNWFYWGKKIRKERPDVLIVRYWLPFMGPCLGTILRSVRKNQHTRIIAITDNIIPHEQRPGDMQFTRYFLKPCHAFVTMSREVLEDLKSFTDRPALYTPHPLYDNYGSALSRAEALRELGLSPEYTYLLFFGFIRKYKGLDLLLEAMSKKELLDERVHLIVAGEFYGDATTYHEMIDRLGLAARVHLFTEFIPNERVRYFFCASDLVVQPYRTATQSGITQIAYHFEKPMVVTRVGGLAENVPDGKVGFVAEPQPESIAAAVRKFLDLPDRPAMQDFIAEEKKQYSWELFVQKLLSLAK